MLSKKNITILLVIVGLVGVFFYGRYTAPDGITKKEWEREKQELLDSAERIYDRNMQILTEENVYLKDSIEETVFLQENYRADKEIQLFNEQRKLDRALKELNRLSAKELQEEMIREAKKYIE